MNANAQPDALRLAAEAACAKANGEDWPCMRSGDQEAQIWAWMDGYKAGVAPQPAQPDAPPPIQRYKIGYQTHEWGERSSAPSGIRDDDGNWVRYTDHAAQIAALTAAQPTGSTSKIVELIRAAQAWVLNPESVKRKTELAALAWRPAEAFITAASQGTAERAVPTLWQIMATAKALYAIDVPEDGDWHALSQAEIDVWRARAERVLKAALAASPAQPAPEPSTEAARAMVEAADMNDRVLAGIDAEESNMAAPAQDDLQPLHDLLYTAQRCTAGTDEACTRRDCGTNCPALAQPTPALGYLPLPNFDAVEQHIYGACRRYITSDMVEPIHNLIRDAIDADRAARAPVASAGATPPRAYAGRERGAWEHGFAAGLAAAPQPPAPAATADALDAELLDLLREIVKLHAERGTVLQVHIERIGEILAAQQKDTP